ncbi:helix-turn-helix transcriptional regulator [Deinococcus radiophilus]|uniref:WYL domain-containing protein n=1 Tax=Deinococcus radiophilus TaxID=32062 RepID=A0A3S0IF85_9DEIO|nr:WYL domain-containing protein [Deinococcus radiophilus]RTR20512.1 WYL domain-containing protein [Deinococcus radiophilus]UFA51479.1 WYL domain-containing protein [Deinococcus radiophilus]
MTYDPTMRLLTVLNLLHGRGAVSGTELARRLEVSPRTVQRYVARLQDLGFPVTSTRGRGASYSLRAAELPPLTFSREEAVALGVGLGSLGLLGLAELAPAAASARAKLRQVLPTEAAGQLSTLEQHAGIGAAAYTVQLDEGVWAAIVEALSQGCLLEMSYLNAAAERSRRRLRPYGTAFYQGRWYLVGWCEKREEERCFRIDRIEKADPTSDTFTAPSDFDVLAYVQRMMPHLPAPFEVSVWLALPAPQVRLEGELGWRTDLSDEAGGTRLRCLRSERRELRMLAAGLLTIDAEIKVDGPPELQEELSQAAARAGQWATQGTDNPGLTRPLGPG